MGTPSVDAPWTVDWSSNPPVVSSGTIRPLTYTAVIFTVSAFERLSPNDFSTTPATVVPAGSKTLPLIITSRSSSALKVRPTLSCEEIGCVVRTISVVPAGTIMAEAKGAAIKQRHIEIRIVLQMVFIICYFSHHSAGGRPQRPIGLWAYAFESMF